MIFWPNHYLIISYYYYYYYYYYYCYFIFLFSSFFLFLFLFISFISLFSLVFLPYLLSPTPHPSHVMETCPSPPHLYSIIFIFFLLVFSSSYKFSTFPILMGPPFFLFGKPSKEKENKNMKERGGKIKAFWEREENKEGAFRGGRILGE